MTSVYRNNCSWTFFRWEMEFFELSLACKLFHRFNEYTLANTLELCSLVDIQNLI